MTNITYSYRVNDAKTIAVQDGLTSLLTGMGGSLDPSRSSFYTPPILTRDQIDNSYRTSWLSALIHDCIPLDMTRAWRAFDAPDDINRLIRKEERRLGLIQKTSKCETLARLYGGSVMMMGVRNDDPREELDPRTVKQGDLKYLHAISRHDISVNELILDPGSSRYGEPVSYNINSGNGRYVEIHPSRIIRYVSKEMPEQIAMANYGWGDPILYSINQAIMDADTAQNSFSALTSKARTDTVTIPNLIELASTTDGEAKLKQRIQLMKAFEGLFSTRILAGPRTSNELGEAWNQFQVTWSGMPEMMDMFWQAVSGASGIPRTRLLGASPGGLNATGQSDTDGYYELISARQEMSLRPRLEMLDEVLLRSATGERDEDWYFTFNPLAVDSASTKAANSKVRADAIKTLADSGAVPEDVLMKLARGQIIESGDYPGADEAYEEYDEAGEIEPLPEPANENALEAATQGLIAQGATPRQAANDAAMMLADAAPMPLYVCRMVLNREEIQSWATEQGFGELQPDLHCTILYSRQPVDWLAMGTSWADRDNDGSGKLLVTAGGPRCVEPLGDRTAVLMFANGDIQWRHEEMVRLGASHDYPDFIPHISLTDKPVDLSNVQPYRGAIEFGPELFQRLED